MSTTHNHTNEAVDGIRMYDPPHPGVMLRDCYILPHDLSLSDAARALGVPRQRVVDLINGDASVDADMAVRLEKVFGFTRDLWLGLQQNYDLWNVDEDAIVIVKSFRPDQTTR